MILIKVIYSILSIVSGGPKSLYQKKGHDSLSGASSNDIEYWLCRCSICFDKNQELCLNRCRDQFCRDCFNRYVKEVVNNSWGLNVTKIKCPVCQDVLPISEWSRYVDSKTLSQYKIYNKPYRSMSRSCGECGEEVFAAKVELELNDSGKRKYIESLEKDCLSLLINANVDADSIKRFLGSLKYDYSYFLEGRVSGGSEIYRKTADHLIQLLPETFGANELMCNKLMIRASEISSRLIAIELKPEVWKELQFEHISRFPQTLCHKCSSVLCLLCGSNDHHYGISCLEYMKRKVEIGAESEEQLKNISWTLKNSKSCPHCRILINRDDGCNKVDCLYCGHRFCWICLSAWSEKCGFYQCQSLPVLLNELSHNEISLNSDKPELGIPDVITIEAKFGRN
ncbi:hypothetical protein K502DRAFT_323451 [Neoconidiobolus thromboides FSU 785]|nr:hypothetical protein K502DRAFT_323451 [Neoconidiobolus thromboides FSU 785]